MPPSGAMTHNEFAIGLRVLGLWGRVSGFWLRGLGLVSGLGLGLHGRVVAVREGLGLVVEGVGAAGTGFGLGGGFWWWGEGWPS